MLCFADDSDFKIHLYGEAFGLQPIFIKFSDSDSGSLKSYIVEFYIDIENTPDESEFRFRSSRINQSWGWKEGSLIKKSVFLADGLGSVLSTHMVTHNH